MNRFRLRPYTRPSGGKPSPHPCPARWLPASVAITILVMLVGCDHESRRDAAREGPLAKTRQVWRWDAPAPAYVGMPAGDETGVAFTSALSRLVLLDGEGRPQWVSELAGLRDVAPRLTPDLVVAPTERGLAAFHRVSGAAAWSAVFGERANTPALDAGAGVLVASTWDGSLFGVDRATGAIRWRSALPGPALGPAASDGRLAVATWVADDHTAAGAVAVDVTSGEQRWSTPLPPGGVSAPGFNVAIGGDRRQVVVVAGDVAAHGLDAGTGLELWRTELEGAGAPEVPPLAVPGGEMLVGHRLGGMALVDGGGRIRWQVASDGAAVRGAPTGPGPGHRFAFPLDDGRVLVAGPGAPTSVLDPPGRVSGVATGPGGLLLVATREASANHLSASSGW